MDETELFPGIHTLPAPGHTPGHTLYVVESKEKKLYWRRLRSPSSSWERPAQSQPSWGCWRDEAWRWGR
jgi:hypothetical protein